MTLYQQGDGRWIFVGNPLDDLHRFVESLDSGVVKAQYRQISLDVDLLTTLIEDEETSPDMRGALLRIRERLLQTVLP